MRKRVFIMLVLFVYYCVGTSSALEASTLKTSCGIPDYSSFIFKGKIKPTCLDKLYAHLYVQSVRQILLKEIDNLDKEINGVLTANDIYQNALSVIESMADLNDLLKADPNKMTMAELMTEAGDQEVGFAAAVWGGYWDYISIWVPLVRCAAEASLADPEAPEDCLKAIGFTLMETIGNLYAAVQVIYLGPKMNDNLIAIQFLERFYGYGRNQGFVALSSGLPKEADIDDIIEAIAQSVVTDLWYWSFSDYDTQRIHGIITSSQSWIDQLVKSVDRDLDGIVNGLDNCPDTYNPNQENACEIPPIKKPNLTPHQPPGWSDKIVVSKNKNTTTDTSSLYETDTLYLDWCVINIGTGATSGIFSVELYVNDVLRSTWSRNKPLNPNGTWAIKDYSLGRLSVGTYRIKMVVDPSGAVDESEERDNEYAKTIIVSPLTNSEYEGFLDSANCENIGGWAWDKNQPNTPISVDIFDGTTKIATVLADQLRQDLNRGNNLHGFTYPTLSNLKDGNKHSINVNFSRTSMKLRNSPRSFTCASEPNERPVARITMTAQGKTAYENQTLNLTVGSSQTVSVSFSAERCSDPDGSITSYKWYIGGIPQSTAMDFSFSFGAGSHDTYLEVWDNLGAKGAVGATIVVSSAQNPTPAISSISPTSRAYPAGTFDLTINGSNFDSGAVDMIYTPWGSYMGSGPRIKSLTATQIVVTEAMGNTPAGTYTVKVQNSDGQLSNGAAFVVTAAPQPPVISSISPTSRPYPAGTFDLTINGSNFDSGAVDMVYTPSNSYMGSGVIKSRSATQIVVTESMGNTAPGTYTVKVKNSDGQISNGMTLVVQSPSAPTAGITMSAQGQTAYENQTLNLTVASGQTVSVSFSAARSSAASGLTIASYKWSINGTQVSTSSDFSFSLGAGTQQIYLQVTDSAGGTGAVGATIVITTQQASAPVISSISPSSRPYPAGTFDLTINGSNFDSGAVDMVYTPSNSYMGSGVIKSRTATQIVVTESMGNTAPGTYTVKVKNSDGQLSNGLTLLIEQQQNQPPVINSLYADYYTIAPGGACTVSVSASDPEGDPLTFSWSASGGSLSATAGAGPVIWTAPTATGNYTITVSVTDNRPGHTAVSKSVTITVSAGPPPGEISLNLYPECSGNNPAIRLTWFMWQVAQGTSFEIYRNGILIVSGLPYSVDFYVDSTVIAGVSYTYFVRARNAAGISDSNSATITAPTNCAFTLTAQPECIGTLSQIRLSWYQGGGDLYKVYRNGSEIFSTSATQYTDLVAPNTSYTYFVRAFTSAGTRDSTSVTVTSLNCGPVIPPPGSFTLTGTSECGQVTPLQIRLTWTTSSGSGVYYKVYRDGVLLGDPYPPPNTFIDTAVMLGTGYTYYVAAINAGGQTNSNQVTLIAECNVPPGAFTLSVIPSCEGSSPKNYLYWDASAGRTLPCEIYRD